MRCTISRRFGIIKSMGIRGAVDVTVDPSGNFQVCDVAVCGRVVMFRLGKCSACVSATVDFATELRMYVCTPLFVRVLRLLVLGTQRGVNSATLGKIL